MPTLLSVSCQLYVDGAWTTYPAFADEGWSAQIGPDVETGTRPNKVEWTFQNLDLSMDPSNVSSALYGKIGRNTPARLLVGGELCRGEAASWEPERTVGHSVSPARGRAWTSMSAEGVLRRIGRWTDPIDSPMVRQISSYSSLSGYWPLEDPSGATRLQQLAPGGFAGKIAGSVTLADNDGPGGSDKTLTLGSDGSITGSFIRESSSGYQICWTADMSAAPSSGTFQPLMTWTDTANRTWQWTQNNTNFGISVVDTDGLSLLNTSAAYGSLGPTEWTRYRVKVTVSGSTITVEPAWYRQDESTPVGYTVTFSGTLTGQPTLWSVPPNAYNNGGSYGHVFAVTDTSLDLLGVTADGKRAFNGYTDELAGARFLRLCSEQGITAYISGTSADTALMGRQKPGQFLDLLQECATTDGALLYDEPLDIALTFRTRLDRMDQSVKVALTYGVDVAQPLKAVIDDVDVANDITVSNADGQSYNTQQLTGALSVLPPPSGVGRVKQSIDVNMSDTSLLDDRGEWERNRGTIDRPRYPTVMVDLFANPRLASAVHALRPGDLITIANLEPDTVRLHVISILHKGGSVERKATLNCVPADIWYQVGVYDATNNRYDSASTTLAGTLTTTATSVPVTTTNALDVWSTTAVPYDWKISGERVTVTAMTAAAGSGPYTQTATVTRSANGIVKTHAAAETVSLADPIRYTF